MENKPLSKLEQWCKENRIDNIEEMLTGVTLSDFMIRNRKVHNLLNSVLYPEWGSLKDLSIRDVETVSSFQNMIDTFFSLLVGTMLNAQPNPTHEAIVNFVNSFKNTGIVTTNYDVCMDQALDNAKIEYSYVIGSQKSQSTMPLIKMHGSINWFYCQTCQHVLMPTVENMRKAIENQMPYSVTGMCPECNSPTKQFIVPPTTYKFLIYPPIVQVWNAGREIFEHSKFYIIVGYSFGLGDDYILKMVLKAIREDPKKQLIIIDKSIETLERFKLLVTTHTVGFPETNLHSIPASAETVVPKVVDILLKRKAKKKTEKVKKTI
jgi:NAD-dependent SIR2 family protein deacetylase